MSGKNTKSVKSSKSLRLIIDTNILLACLLRDSTTRELLLDNRVILYAPEHLISETQKHLIASDRVRRRINLSKSQLISLFTSLTAEITVINSEDYSSHINTALGIAPHPEDAPFLALGLHLKIPLWTNDAGIAQQNQVQIITTSELFKLLIN